jgi:hypothetical protein
VCHPSRSTDSPCLASLSRRTGSLRTTGKVVLGSWARYG